VLDTDSWTYFSNPADILDRIEAALGEHRPKLLLFSSPDNPTGRMVPDDAFEEIVAMAARHDCIVAVDYAYRAQYFTPDPPDHFSASPAAHDNLVAIHSNSKWCRGLGRRLGWAFARPELIEALSLVQQSIILCPDTFHQEALARYFDAALSDGSLTEYLESSRRDYAHAAAHMTGCLEDHLRMPYLEPQGGLYSVVDVGEDADAFVREVLAATGVIFVPGGGFGDTLARAIRISFGPLVNDLDRMEEGFKRVRAFLDARGD
jgi:aspartate aminotransferase